MCPDEGGGAAGGRRGQLRVPSRALHVTAAERRGERAAGRPGEGRPDGARAEGDVGGRGAVEEIPTHHQRDDRHQERTVTLKLKHKIVAPVKSQELVPLTHKTVSSLNSPRPMF